MIRYKYITIGLVAISLAAACTKDTGSIAPVFNGTICTDQEVDLGLAASWAGYNVGADAPQEYGNHYAWGETASKAVYLEDTYENPSMNVLDELHDVASQEWGYGWHMPSVNDIKELIENCDISFVSYRGVDGWAATSRVPGYEGKTIFFPAAGYRAGENTNYQGQQCVFWSNSLVSDGATHAVNAFFDGNTLKLNEPPKGKGGTLWCGYTVRPVRQFFLDIDMEDTTCNRDETSLTFNVSGNSRWTASVVGEGASISPQSGEGAGVVTVTYPENNTEDNKFIDVTIASPEIAEPCNFRITQFGMIPDFYIAGETQTTVAWDYSEAVKFNLTAAQSVSWTAAVMMDGVVLEGAVVTPASGTGSAEISVTLPDYLDTINEGVCQVVLTTDNEKIPEEIRSIEYIVNRTCCTYIPFGFNWDSSFLNALKAAFEANKSASSYTVMNTTVTPGTPGTLSVSSYIGKSLKLTFQSAESGDAILSIKATVASGSSTKRIRIYLNDVQVDALSNSTGSSLSVEQDIKITGVKKGDTIGVTMNDSNNHRIYSMSYKKAN